MKKKIAVVLLLTICLIGLSLRESSFTEAQARKTLYWGSRGSDVSLLQWRLSQWGYFNGPIDGVYGAKTFEAVKLFQRRNGLRVDGVCGSGTWSALGLGGGSQGGQSQSTGTKGITNNNDVQLLARIIHAEARAEPYTGQVAVGAVILNRVRSSEFPNTIASVLYQPLAFESVSNGQFNIPPNSENFRAARDAINGWDPSYGSLFFWNPSKPVISWIWSRNVVVQYGDHVFAK